MSIRARVIVALLCVALPALAAVGAFAWWRSYEGMLATQTASMLAVAESRAERLRLLRLEWFHIFDRAAGQPELVNALRLYADRPYSRFRRRIGRILDRSVDGSRAVAARIQTTAGAGVADVGTFSAGTTRVRPRNGLDAPTVVEVLPENGGLGPWVTIAGPVRDGERPLGYLTVQVEATGLRGLVAGTQGLGIHGAVQVAARDLDNRWHVLASSSGDVVEPTPSMDPSTTLVRHEDAAGYAVLQAASDASSVLRVTVAASEADIVAPATAVRNAVAGFALLAAMGVALVGWIVARRMTADVLQLSAAVADIRSGNLERRAPVQGADEVATLAEAFNALASQLIEDNNRLEDRVRERTAELARINTALEARAVELARSNAELEQFASVASHDLQEPLRKVQAFGDRLHSRYADHLDSRGQDYIARMRESAGRMQTLIEDLLAYSRVSSRPGCIETVDLGSEVAAALQDLSERVDEADATVEVGPLPSLVGDATQLRQLFQNLLGNALKYHDPERPLVVRVESVEDDDSVTITVSDNGIGFDSQYADRIFGIFQRLHGRDRYDGTGVGLAICRRIIERHEGRISASGSPGEGAVFTVELPRSPPPSPNVGEADWSREAACDDE